MDNTFAIIVFIAVALGLYFVPFWVALFRGHRYRAVIFALNLIGGWSGLGWLAAFVWAVWPSGATVTDVVTHDPTGLSARNVGSAAAELQNEHERARVPAPRHMSAARPEALGTAEPRGTSVTFEIITKSGARRFSHDGLPCMLGSGPDADVRIRHPSVAALHAVVRSAPDGVVICAVNDSALIRMDAGPLRRMNVPFGGTFRIGAVPVRLLGPIDPDAIYLD